jgi:hypothetical protein
LLDLNQQRAEMERLSGSAKPKANNAKKRKKKLQNQDDQVGLF